MVSYAAFLVPPPSFNPHLVDFADHDSHQIPCRFLSFAGQDTVERHGGFDVVMEKTVRREQHDPASNGHEMIDKFRLWGSLNWRRRGVPLSGEGGDIEG